MRNPLPPEFTGGKEQNGWRIEVTSNLLPQKLVGGLPFTYHSGGEGGDFETALRVPIDFGASKWWLFLRDEGGRGSP